MPILVKDIEDGDDPPGPAPHHTVTDRHDDGPSPDVTAEAIIISGAAVDADGAIGPLLAELADAGVHVARTWAEPLDAFRDRLAHHGIGPGLVLAIGQAAVEATSGWQGYERAHRVAGTEPGAVTSLLRDQLARRAERRVPGIDEDPAWTVAIGDGTEFRTRPSLVQESLLTVANGTLGARGAREGDVHGHPLVFASGVFDGRGDNPILLAGPVWTGLVTNGLDGASEHRVLDLRTGVLGRECRIDGEVVLRTIRFLSLVRRGAAGMRAEGRASRVAPGRALHLPADAAAAGHRVDGQVEQAWTEGDPASSITVASRTLVRRDGGRRTIDRLAAYVPRAGEDSARADAAEALAELDGVGLDGLLAEHREAWAARWADAHVAIVGAPDLELAVRLALFHLIGSVADEGEAAVGPRGMSGAAYGGHVLWDADVFVSPVMAATHPAAARAMLEYRIRRLPAARAFAAASGFDGARFPWESGADGTDVTPHMVRRSGQVIPILTGQHEEHVVADVAWAALHYVAWTGDRAFLAGEGGALVTDTARYWASRVRWIDGQAHLFGVVGPDEYHEVVDDNTYTNVMAAGTCAELPSWSGRATRPRRGDGSLTPWSTATTRPAGATSSAPGSGAWSRSWWASTIGSRSWPTRCSAGHGCAAPKS